MASAGGSGMSSAASPDGDAADDVLEGYAGWQAGSGPAPRQDVVEVDRDAGALGLRLRSLGCLAQRASGGLGCGRSLHGLDGRTGRHRDAGIGGLGHRDGRRPSAPRGWARADRQPGCARLPDARRSAGGRRAAGRTGRPWRSGRRCGRRPAPRPRSAGRPGTPDPREGPVPGGPPARGARPPGRRAARCRTALGPAPRPALAGPRRQPQHRARCGRCARRCWQPAQRRAPDPRRTRGLRCCPCPAGAGRPARARSRR